MYDSDDPFWILHIFFVIAVEASSIFEEDGPIEISSWPYYFVVSPLQLGLSCRNTDDYHTSPFHELSTWKLLQNLPRITHLQELHDKLRLEAAVSMTETPSK
jgi:hypothetical protein